MHHTNIVQAIKL